MDKDLELMKELTETAGPPGFEVRIHEVLHKRLSALTENIVTDNLGSHVLSIEERRNVLDINQMFVDIGATSKEEAESFGVEVGDPIVPICPFEVLPNPTFLLAKAWDNRAGCYVAVKTLEAIKEARLPNVVYAGATVQEEVGLRGAQTLAHTITPDIAFALDVGFAGDTPGMNHKEGHSKLGAGPLLGFYDVSMIPHLKLRDFVIQTAKERMAGKFTRPTMEFRRWLSVSPLDTFTVTYPLFTGMIWIMPCTCWCS